MQTLHVKMLEKLDDLEALLITAEGLAGRINLKELTGTVSCIRDTLSEIRRIRKAMEAAEPRFTGNS
ncbi:MAG: hypothetical protein ACT6RL_21820 [Neoaquamicrobium sediminum]|uniref:hypothetical protein n=1 Tax=Neoaquamicrobium sediminum TaxID=1849104 RepID=UPI0040382608